MGRPKEFDRVEAVERAMQVFQAKGFAGATLNHLTEAMQIGRQSLYDTFGDKRALFLEALARYYRSRREVHRSRLHSADDPLDGIRAMLQGVVDDHRRSPEIGYLVVGAIAEFGCTDADVVKCRVEGEALLHKLLVERLNDGRRRGQFLPALDSESAAWSLQTTMYGFQIAARGGMREYELCGVVERALDPWKR